MKINLASSKKMRVARDVLDERNEKSGATVVIPLSKLIENIQ